MIQLDVTYGQRRSLMTDLKIIVLTPSTLVMQIFDLRRRPMAKSASIATAVPPVTTVTAAEEAPAEALSTTFVTKSQNVRVDSAAERPAFMAQPAQDAFVSSTKMEAPPRRLPRQTDRTSTPA